MNTLPRILLALFLPTLLASPLIGQTLKDYEQAPIHYFEATTEDRVGQLQLQIERGTTKLKYDREQGYLPAVLDALDIPTSSQTLVFSKTSLQVHQIAPKRPRAIYFNDDVYVGYCQDGKTLELATSSPKQGTIFYTLKQAEANNPKFVRDQGACMSCHLSSRTQNVPGYVVRSVFPKPSGHPDFRRGSFNTDQRSKFSERWGGWYVTGNHGTMRHMGNVICQSADNDIDREAGANVTDLSKYFNVKRYPTPHSDIVALMVLEHQTQMHNALAWANFESRRAVHQSNMMNKILKRPDGFISESAQRRIQSAADKVVEHLLMCDEFQLTGPVSGSSAFVSDFVSRGKKDARGRSLRDFDLTKRLFRYPCSYLIHSSSFKNLPDVVRKPILKKLKHVLSGSDNSPQFAHLTGELRAELLQILQATNVLPTNAGFRSPNLNLGAQVHGNWLGLNAIPNRQTEFALAQSNRLPTNTLPPTSRRQFRRR